jgi:peptidyl-prolyl cis-trans isomerase SurA
MKYAINILFLSFILLNLLLQAQNMPVSTLSQGDLIDKIVAIVGKEIILKSDIDAIMLDEINKGGKYDINDKELRKKILDRFIDEKIFVTKAEEDSVVVDDNMVEERFNMAVQQLISYYGSVERLEAMYKKSLSRLKMEYKDEIKKNLMSDQLQQKEFSGTTVNTKEISDFYDEVKDSLPTMPEQIEIYHIYKTIEPNLESKEKTLALAKKIRDSIISGADFGTLAKEYSEDPGSKDEGGELGWVEKGKFVAEFEMAAIALQKGEISMPVETPFGYHIIKLIDKNKDSIHTQHILLKLIQSDEDINRVRIFLDSLRKTGIENNNFEELAMRHSDDAATKGFGGYIGKIMLSINPMGYSDVLSSLKDGEISEPLPFSNVPTKQGMHIVWRKKTISEHQATITDDYEFLKAKAIEYKIMKLREKWLTELRKQIYWEVFE